MIQQPIALFDPKERDKILRRQTLPHIRQVNGLWYCYVNKTMALRARVLETGSGPAFTIGLGITPSAALQSFFKQTLAPAGRYASR